MLTVKNPPNGQDPLQASSENFYSGVTLKDLTGFTERYELNSRLVKRNGRVMEEVYRAGTPDGKFRRVSTRASWASRSAILQQALPYAPDSQKKVINDLIRYYQTGERADWIQCGIDWVQDKSNPDFSNGFVEVYKDPRGLKGAIQGFVSVVDTTMSKLMAGFRRQRRLLRAARSVARQIQEPESEAAGGECRGNGCRDRAILT